MFYHYHNRIIIGNYFVHNNSVVKISKPSPRSNFKYANLGSVRRVATQSSEITGNYKI